MTERQHSESEIDAGWDAYDAHRHLIPNVSYDRDENHRVTKILIELSPDAYVHQMWDVPLGVFLSMAYSHDKSQLRFVK